jgi:tetratricopeptide (TPR) repeat protein
MRRQYIYGLFILFFAFLITPILNIDTRDFSLSAETSKIQIDSYGDQLGTVQFPMSCSDEAVPQVEKGVALLHHMTYHGARSAFVAAAQSDPKCAMSYWGQAMTYIHPLWSDAPSKEDFETGQSLIEKARIHGEKTDREEAYIEAVAAYYEKGWNKKETKNLQSFEAGWGKVHQKYPKDIEAASFYALAHMATASPGDKTYTKQKQAGAIVEKVLIQVPDHPGAHHYLIHAYDYPPTAPKALNVARSYGKIAPDIPHALHMPTHIFTRVGLWRESIVMNKRSAAAALRHPAGSEISLHYPHALDYLVYAYLQQADDRSARQVMAEILDHSGSFQAHIAASYAFTAIPARFALERQQWEEAATLKPRLPNNYSMVNFPAMESVTYFARALGAARSGNVTTANQALEKLTEFQKRAEKTSAYWTQQIEIQRLSAMAWTMYQEGKKKEALMVMQQAAELESSTEKHPVTPGEILPARELLGDMLLDMGRYGEARSEYETALKRSPNRLNSLYGAGLAAELGHDEDAELYYRKIVEMTDIVATDREQVKHAKRYLAKGI